MQISGYQNLSFGAFDFIKRQKRTQEKPDRFQELKPVSMPDIQDIFVKKEFVIREIPDHIDFKPTKTIDEAKKFAEENLLIYDYQLTDVDCANYINEALSEYYNKNDIKKPVIKNILAAETGGETFATINCFNWTLSVNERMFNKADYYIDKFLNDETVKKRCENLDRKCNLTESQEKYFEYYKAGAKNHSELPLKEKIGFMLFLRGLSSERMVDNADGKTALPDGGPFWIINHEIGHLEHFENAGIAQYRNLGIGFKNGMPREDAKAKFREIEPDWESTLKVSDYAASNPKEFVAEVFACLQNGVKFDDDVMELYEKYGGPKIA